MFDVSSVAIEDFDYPLPEEKIAKYPLLQRDKAKLLCFGENGLPKDHLFCELPELLSKDTLLILNDTKVVYARLFFQKESGSTIEIFCLEPIEPCEMQLAFAQKHKCKWKCLVGNNKKWKNGKLSKHAQINNQDITLSVERVEQKEECWIVEFEWNGNKSFAEILQTMGVVPLPPYIKRQAEETDKSEYQTIYADQDGSVAAPTAGLHFSDETFACLKEKGIRYDFVTLHVGAGTFKPVSTKTIGEHSMHTEKVCVSKETIADLINYCDKKIVCVGTTSVRTIESLYWHGVRLLNSDGAYKDMDIKQWEPYQKEVCISRSEALKAILQSMEQSNREELQGQTSIIIAPSYRYRITDGMVTNFHQPKSTLLLLVDAMIGNKWKKAYAHALENDYRFLSYGDACLFFKEEKS